MKHSTLHLIAWLCAVWLLGCTAHMEHSTEMHPADELNRRAYAWRYRDLDSTTYYAVEAFDEAKHYKHGRSVACNTLGFVAYMHMDYEGALAWYHEVDEQSGCELERLVADVGRMNVYMRTADNLAFYDSRVSAMKRLAHINEEVEHFSPNERARLQSAVNDLYMVTALHHYMIGQRPEAHAEMDRISDDDALRTDSAQWLMMQYLKGLGLDVEGDTPEQRLLRRYTYLNTCLRTGREGGYQYFVGLASSGLAELLADSVRSAYLARLRPNSFYQLTSGASDAAFGLAADAYQCLQEYGDRYGLVNAKVQIASLYNRRGQYMMALDTLLYMLEDSTLVPDVLCRLHEEASLAYAGLGEKAASDHHRNLYLDLLEMTRQDKELESRFLELKRQKRMMNILLGTVVAGVVILVILIALLSRYRHRRGGGYEQQLRDLLQETTKRVYLHQMHVVEGKRDNVVRRATFSMITGMIPYIDRMAHEVGRLQQPEVWNNMELRTRKLGYIDDLASEISNLNEVLARWIKTKQGVVGLHVENFALADVLDMIEQSSASFAMKGLTLDVYPTDAVVKADKALTFFMLNTLADNARKFTPEGGRVSVNAQVCEEYVELSVSDTGVGMSPEEIDKILHEKIYDASAIGEELPLTQRKNKGSGFGLLNCKGIIEKYRKTDGLFEVCRMGIDSRMGEGSRFWFRLPKGVRRVLSLLGVILLPSVAVSGNLPPMADGGGEATYDTLLVQASAFADSVYYANIDGRYEEALRYADSAIAYLNLHHRRYASEYIAPLTATHGGEQDVEIRWWLSDFATDYHTILDVRNELAVANLALRRWDDYRYNNRMYNDLYKLFSEDRSLIDYCNRMQRYNSNISVAVLICILLAIGYLILLVYAFMGRVESVYRDIEAVEDDESRVRHEENRLHVQNMVLDNCLSTIKHETVYYPNRIKQLVSRLGEYDERAQMKELVDYYKVVFTTLTNCASRQLDEVTFRRSAVVADVLLLRAATYYTKCCRQYSDAPRLTVEPCGEMLQCDSHLIDFLFEQLINASLASSRTDSLQLKAEVDGEFVRFDFVNTSRTVPLEVLRSLFYPTRIDTESDEASQGGEYIVCRQIMREHDAHFGHIGCRINAAPLTTGYTVWFTLPRYVRPVVTPTLK